MIFLLRRRSNKFVAPINSKIKKKNYEHWLNYLCRLVNYKIRDKIFIGILINAREKLLAKIMSQYFDFQ